MLKQIGSKTFKNLQINSGLLFYDFRFDSDMTAARLRERIGERIAEGSGFLGATRDGIEFSAVPRFKAYKEDGEIFQSDSCCILEGWDVKLSAALVEYTSEIVSQVIPQSFSDDQGGFLKSIYPGMFVKPEINENIVWIGDLSCGGLIVIELKNAVNVGGIKFVANRDGENGFVVGFVPFRGTFFDKGEPPFGIHLLKERDDE
jgi:hypothetical protein